MKTLTQAYKDLHESSEKLTALRKEFAAQEKLLLASISSNQALISLTESQVDIAKTQLAETIIYVSKYTGVGDQKSCIDDAIKQFATGKPNSEEYSNLWKTTLSTKNYDSWSSQRSDHAYGYGPRHGSINFSVGLTQVFRDSKRKYVDLTPEEIEAVIYYLTNVKKIQEIKLKAA
jgi:hypothetical protein